MVYSASLNAYEDRSEMILDAERILAPLWTGGSAASGHAGAVIEKGQRLIIRLSNRQLGNLKRLQGTGGYLGYVDKSLLGINVIDSLVKKDVIAAVEHGINYAGSTKFAEGMILVVSAAGYGHPVVLLLAGVSGAAVYVVGVQPLTEEGANTLREWIADPASEAYFQSDVYKEKKRQHYMNMCREYQKEYKRAKKRSMVFAELCGKYGIDI